MVAVVLRHGGMRDGIDSEVDGMSNFVVGDKVRVIKDTNWPSYRGKVGEVIWVRDDWGPFRYRVAFDPPLIPLFFNGYELEEASDEQRA